MAETSAIVEVDPYVASVVKLLQGAEITPRVYSEGMSEADWGSFRTLVDRGLMVMGQGYIITCRHAQGALKVTVVIRGPYELEDIRHCVYAYISDAEIPRSWRNWLGRLKPIEEFKFHRLETSGWLSPHGEKAQADILRGDVNHTIRWTMSREASERFPAEIRVHVCNSTQYKTREDAFEATESANITNYIQNNSITNINPIDTEELAETLSNKLNEHKQQVTHDLEDGPTKVKYWRWNGEEYGEMTTKPWLFAKYLFEATNMTLSKESLAEPLLGDRNDLPTDAQVDGWINKSNNFFRENKIPLKSSRSADYCSMVEAN